MHFFSLIEKNAHDFFDSLGFLVGEHHLLRLVPSCSLFSEALLVLVIERDLLGTKKFWPPHFLNNLVFLLAADALPNSDSDR